MAAVDPMVVAAVVILPVVTVLVEVAVVVDVLNFQYLRACRSFKITFSPTSFHLQWLIQLNLRAVVVVWSSRMWSHDIYKQLKFCLLLR